MILINLCSADEGETTDEEVIPPSTITRPQALLRKVSYSREKTPIPAERPTTKSRFLRRGPSMGSWIADPTKPIAVIDSSGKHMVIIPAQRPLQPEKRFSHIPSSGSSTANNSPRNSFVGLANAVDDSENDRSDYSNQEFVGPMLGSGANLMIPGLLHGAPGSEHILGGQVLGPPEAFYPFTSIEADGNIVQEEDEDDDDDDEDLWNVNDFIDFGDGSSDSEKEGSDTEVLASPATSMVAIPGSTPIRPDNSHLTSTTAVDLLEHLDRGVVTAFRRNQNRHQTYLRRPLGTSGRAVITGSRGLGINTPISPMRKKKLDQKKSATAAAITKRRVQNGNKRSRSKSSP